MKLPQSAYLVLFSLLFVFGMGAGAIGYGNGVTVGANILSTWSAMGLFYTISVAFLLTVTPIAMRAEEFATRELFPVGMLVLFLFILNEIQWRPITATLFFTAGGLIVLRAILLLLSRLRTSQGAVPPMLYGFVAGGAVEVMFSIHKVYLTFHPVLAQEHPPSTILVIASPLLMMVGMVYGWFRERGFRWALLPGPLLLLGTFYDSNFKIYGIFLFSIGLSYELWLYLSQTVKKSS